MKNDKQAFRFLGFFKSFALIPLLAITTSLKNENTDFISVIKCNGFYVNSYLLLQSCTCTLCLHRLFS